METPVKIQKTISPDVRAANRANAKASTGPRTEEGKFTTSQNALQHGILARKVAFKDENEKAEFQKLLQSSGNEFRPAGLEEAFLVEEIATIWWRLGIALGLETLELSRHRDAHHRLNGVFESTLELPISASDLPLGGGWDCERMVVRAVAAKDSGHTNASRGPSIVQNQIVSGFHSSQNNTNQEAGLLEIEATLSSAHESDALSIYTETRVISGAQGTAQRPGRSTREGG
jgi:hypothetical protein